MLSYLENIAHLHINHNKLVLFEPLYLYCHNLHTRFLKMSYTLYDTSIPAAKNALTALANIIRKGQEHANAANFLNSTLSEDMKPLSFQIIFASTLAEKLVARLSGTAVSDAKSEISTLAEGLALVENALKSLDSADKAVINANAKNSTEVGMGPGVNIPMAVDAYASAFALPNIFFHVMTAYSILRKEGVPIGKKDYLAPFMGSYMP